MTARPLSDSCGGGVRRRTLEFLGDVLVGAWNAYMRLVGVPACALDVDRPRRRHQR